MSENVVQGNSQDLERVADINKKVSLTEQWINGKLEEYKKYYCKTKWFEDIFQVRCYNKDTEDEWWVLENERYKYNNVYHTKDIEVLAPAPSYKEWIELGNKYDSLQEQIFAQASIYLENQQLKELLKECRYMILAYSINHDTFTKEKVSSMIAKIDNTIGEMQKK